MKRLIYRTDKALIVFRLGKTSNAKISNDAKLNILETYSFSKEQFELANSGQKFTMQSFFLQDKAVCFDCPFSGNQNGQTGKCYTHKFNQYMGFLSMLRSIGRTTDFNSIEYFPEETPQELLDMSTTYIRFGSYGEPSIIPYNIISEMVAVCKASGNNWTGYTHQMKKNPILNKYFMNSAHDLNSIEYFKSFVVTADVVKNKDVVNCPASAEGGNKASCNTCGLCSGTEGKGSKSVVIVNH